ncbi:MAG: hypothetical protein BWY82_02809 [Verrucomicrobia bacterium ADurb.Bin474]|nr:MAG: hypothetical protein BWY82_02809 [Verrucomicrobia bacterium ADurb.Bin474]
MDHFLNCPFHLGVRVTGLLKPGEQLRLPLSKSPGGEYHGRTPLKRKRIAKEKAFHSFIVEYRRPLHLERVVKEAHARLEFIINPGHIDITGDKNLRWTLPFQFQTLTRGGGDFRKHLSIQIP